MERRQDSVAETGADEGGRPKEERVREGRKTKGAASEGRVRKIKIPTTWNKR